MSALKNLASLKRTITKRVREALQELQENLGNLGGSLERAPVPVRVPVPSRGSAPFRSPIPRGYYRISGKFVSRSAWAIPGVSFANGSRGFQYPSARFFSTYNKFGGFNSWRWARINQSVIFQNFSSKSQFRSKSFHRFYKAPTLTQLLKKKSGLYDETSALDLGPSDVVARARRSAVPAKLRLNLSLTQKFHDVVLDLAKPFAAQSASTGCYLDFKIEPSILVPTATIMSADVLAELLTNLKRFERHVADLQRDLLRLSELGELPLKFVAEENVIRVYFPNCDRAQLEGLLLEKNVAGGVIHEDKSSLSEQIEDDSQVMAISEFDILSSCNSMSSGSSSSASDDYDDILSSSATSSKFEKVVHLEPVAVSGHVEFVDDYHWA